MSDSKPSGAWVKTPTKARVQYARLSWDAECCLHKLYLYCAAVGNDGRMPLAELHVAMDRKIPTGRARKALDELVAFDEVLIEGEMVVLDWSDQFLAAEWNDPVARERRTRNNRLKRDGELCKRIQARDRNLCRYCGIRVNWADKKGAQGGTYDHVDPDGDNQAANVVVSCRHCNGRKRDRTPDQWIATDPEGRTLKRPGTTSAQANDLDRARKEAPG